MVADSGGDILALKRAGGWKSTEIAMSYVDDSVNKKSKCLANYLVVRRAQMFCSPRVQQFLSQQMVHHHQYQLFHHQKSVLLEITIVP